MDNLIFKVSKAYPKISCKKTIKYFEDNIRLAKPGTGGDSKLNNLEININLNENDFSNLGNTLVKCLTKFKKKYPEIDKHLQRWAINENVSLMKYEPNQYYHYVHCENDGPKRYPKRVFAWMIFLNNIKKGGGTKFIYQKTTIKAIEGDFYMWPAYWSHFHTGVKAPKETKYILTGWCSYL